MELSYINQKMLSLRIFEWSKREANTFNEIYEYVTKFSSENFSLIACGEI